MAFAYDSYTNPSKNNGVLRATLTLLQFPEAFVDAVDRWGFEHPPEPLRRVEFRAIRRHWQDADVFGNPSVALPHVEASLVHDHHMQHPGIGLGDLAQKCCVNVMVDGRGKEQLHRVF